MTRSLLSRATGHSASLPPVLRDVLVAIACAASLLSLAATAGGQTPPTTATSGPSLKLTEAQALVGQRKFADAVLLLHDLLKTQPLLGPAWMALGAAWRGQGMTDSAIVAYTTAYTRPGSARQAALQLLLLYAQTGRPDSAAHWLEATRNGGIDFTAVVANREIETLRSDSRFASLFPAKADLDKPFVERVHIIHEWRGEAAGDEFGWIARGIGDVDGDGVTDVVASATANLPMGTTKGRVYVYSGQRGALLWKQEGPAGSFFGTGLESAGDVNRDGIPDVIVGAPGINTAFVYSGQDGHVIWKLTGDSTVSDLGSSVTGVGDVNHDGYADVAVSAPRARNATGRVFIFSGKDGTVLRTLDGEQPGDSFGSTVGAGDGRHFVVGASGAGPQRAGRVYAYDGLTATPMFVQTADSTGSALGAMFVSVVGDVDGDGTADMYATDFANSANGSGSGRAYVVSGKTGKLLFVKTGETAGESLGIGAGRVGDVNGDGHADFVVGGWQYRGAAWSGGRVQVFSGKDGSVLQTFTGRVPGETLGFDAVGVGDVDGDGKTDYLLTSAWSTVNGVRSGRVYIVSGTVVNAKAKAKAKANH